LGSNFIRLLSAMGEEERILEEIEALRKEHRELDVMIENLGSSAFDQLQLQRLKKRKLMIKDKVSHLEGLLHPDIIA